MAGKFNKFLAFTAAAGAIAAGVYYYLQNKNANQYDDFDDDVDFDDFSEDLEEETDAETQRSYVDLNLEKAAEHLSAHADATEVQEEITEQEIQESDSDASVFDSDAPVSEPEVSVSEPEVSVSEPAALQETEEEDSFYAAVEEAFDTAKNTLSFETQSSAEALKTTIEEFFDDEDDMDSI